MSTETNYQANFTVRIGDINYGGHLGNDKYLLLFHDARIGFLESIGFSEKDIGDGLGLIMKDACIDFKGEVFLHDNLNVSIRISDIKGIQFRINYQIERETDRKTVATGYTSMVAFDYQTRKIGKLPGRFIEQIKTFSTGESG